MEYSYEFYNRENTFESYLEIQRRNKVLRSARQCEIGRVLDIGPGGMHYYDCIPHWSEYIMVDPVQEFIDGASSHVTGICSKFEDAKLKGKFDFIIASGMLHLIKDRDLVLAKIHSLCHEDTLIHINVPNAESFHRILGFHMGLLDDIRDQSENDLKYGHGKNFTIDELMTILNLNNFYVHRISTYGLKPFSDKQMTKILNRDIMDGLNSMNSLFSNYGCEIAVEAYIEL